MPVDEQIKQIIQGIAELQQQLLNIWDNAVKDRDAYEINDRLSRWRERVARYLNEKVSKQEADRFKNMYLSDLSNADLAGEMNYYLKLMYKALKALSEDIEADPSILDIASRSEIDQSLHKNKIEAEDSKSSQLSPSKNCVFIGHGRSPLWARLQIFLENDLHLQSVNYESESRVGESIVPILEKMLEEATFAVLLLTAEDETLVGQKRARQNVVHEAGLFQGRLGFKRAVLLIQDGIEDFTNVAGLQYIGFSGDRIDQTFYELQRVLKREGLI